PKSESRLKAAVSSWSRRRGAGIPWTSCSPNAIQKLRAPSKNKNGSLVSPSAASSSDEARRNLARQPRTYIGTRAKTSPSRADRVAGGLQPDNETPRNSPDNKRR